MKVEASRETARLAKVLKPLGRAEARRAMVLRARAHVLECDRLDEMASLLATQRVDAIILAPLGFGWLLCCPVLRIIRMKLPSVPVAIYCRLSAAAIREYM